MPRLLSESAFTRARNALVPLLDRTSIRGLIVGAIALRVVFCSSYAAFIDIPRLSVPVEGETYFLAGADGYLQIARTLLLTGEYAFFPGGPPVHNRGPVHPVLMLVFGAWSARYWYWFWFVGTALLSTATLFVVRALARDAGMSVRWTKLLLLTVGFHPYLVFISKTPTFMNTGILLVTLALWLFLRIRRAPLRGAIWTGAACGIAALTHGTYLALPFLFGGLLLFLRGLPAGRRLAVAAVLVATSCAIVAPWTIRNARAFHLFIPVVTGNGYHYWKGTRVYFQEPDAEANALRAATGRELKVLYFGAERPEDDQALWSAAVEDMKRRPLRALIRIPIGWATFLAPWDLGIHKAAVAGAFNVPLAAFCLLFAWRNSRRRRLAFSDVSILAVVFYLSTAYGFFLSWGSYFNMVLPVCLFLAASLYLRSRGWTGSPLDETAQAPASISLK